MNFLSIQESELLIKNIKNQKHLVITLFMIDAGLRVSEVITLQLLNLDFHKRLLTVKSLKKRKDNEQKRIIPLSDRLFLELNNYIIKSKIKLDKNSYLFPAGSSHISRQSVNKFLKSYKYKLSIPSLHPHALRHSFATHHLNAGSSLEQIKTMLGHRSFDTTLVYASIPTTVLHQRVNAVSQHYSKKNKLLEWFIKLFSSHKKEYTINLNFAHNDLFVGREDILEIIQKNISKNQNSILIGSVGVGKSTILDKIKNEKKIIKIDDTSSIKKTLANILLWLFNGDKAEAIKLLYHNYNDDSIPARINRESVVYLIDTIKALVKPKEYILIIDDITGISNTSMKAIEKLKDTFIFIVAAREIKAQNSSFLWNFERYSIDNLNRHNSLLLINELSRDLNIEDITIFRTHIYEQSQGNPRAIYELLHKYNSETFISKDNLRKFKHQGSLQDMDFSYIIIVFLIVLVALKFFSKEFDEPIFKIIGSLAMIILIFARVLLKHLKRSTY